jgi:predicted ATPase
LNRVERLSYQAQDLLKVAAILGRTVESDLLEMVGGLAGGHDIESSLTTWQERRLVRPVSTAEAGDQYDFAHDKIREVVYHQLPINQRQQLAYDIETLVDSKLEVCRAL